MTAPDVSTESLAGGTRLRCSADAGSAEEAIVGDVLELVELGSPGDTRLRLEQGRIVITRFVAGDDRDRLRDAEAAMASLAGDVVGMVSSMAATNAAASAAPPSFAPPPAVVTELSTRYWTVGAPQSGWVAPDPSTAPVATLAVGEWLDVLERIGDWARVRSESGHTVYIDARSLVPAGGATS